MNMCLQVGLAPSICFLFIQHVAKPLDERQLGAGGHLFSLFYYEDDFIMSQLITTMAEEEGNPIFLSFTCSASYHHAML